MWCQVLVVATTLFQFHLITTAEANNAPNIHYSHNMRILKLPRHLPPGTLVYRLKGSDPDPDVLTFGVKEHVGNQLLDIRSAGFTEADVYLRSHLQADEYNLTIFVSDGQKSTEVVSTIKVTDPESPPPAPFVDFYPLFGVLENTTIGSTVGFVTARDRDGSNLAVTFELRGSDRFTIRYVFGPRGTSKAELLLVKELDYERKNLYSLKLLALNAWTNESVDTRNVATADIVIAVKDTADKDELPALRLGQTNAVSLFADMAHKTQLVLWILMTLVILTLVFLLLLLACWCCCRYSERRNKLVPMAENWSKPPPPAAMPAAVDDSKSRGSSLNKQFGRESRQTNIVNGYEETQVRPMSAPDDSVDSQANNPIVRVGSLRNFRHARNRVSPDYQERALSENRGYVSDNRDIEAIRVVGDRHGRMRNIREIKSSTGTYILADEASGYGNKFKSYGRSYGRKIKPRPRKTEILYIRSPLQGARSVEGGSRSVSETARRSFDEEDEEDYDSPLSADIVDQNDADQKYSGNQSRNRTRRQVSFKVNSVDGASVPGTVSDQEDMTYNGVGRHRSVSNTTLSSQVLADINSSLHGNRRGSNLSVNQSSDSGRSRQSATSQPAKAPPLPGSVEDIEDSTMDTRRPRETTDAKHIYKADHANGDSSSVGRTSVSAKNELPLLSPPKVSLKPPNSEIAPSEQFSERSDSDSGIGHHNRQQRVSELNLKNSNLMEKKSIFTIAYDGVKTSRLKSAESGAETP